MRHGRSEANEQGLIVSSIAHGGNAYGLTEEGRKQVRDSVSRHSELNSDTVIISSDFLRTKETAALASSLLQAPAPLTSELLRERYFGSCELKSDSFYEGIWEEDRQGLSSMQAESPEDVQNRFRMFITEMEEKYRGEQILIVSHGDILQIALTWGEGIPPAGHRSLIHLNTAEIRPFPDTRRKEI